MDDFLHCNNCYTRPHNGIGFFLTSCGHLFCSTCTEACTKDACRVCMMRGCSVLPLEHPLKPDVENFFKTVPDIVSSQARDLQRVLGFQNLHRKALNGFMQHRIHKLEAQLEDAGRKNQKLVAENQSLRSKLQACAQAFYRSKISAPTPNGMNRNSPTGKDATSPNTVFSPNTLSRLFANSSPTVSTRTGHPTHPHGSFSGRASSALSEVGSPCGSSVSASPPPTFLSAGSTPVRNNRMQIRSPPVQGMLGPLASSQSSQYSSQIASKVLSNK